MNAQTLRWALWSGAAVTAIAVLAVVAFFALRTQPQPQPPVTQQDQLDASFRPVATQMTNLQHRLIIYDMTLAMRVARGALKNADVQPALLQRAQELEARDGGDAPLVVEQTHEAATYFQFIDSRIAASSTWPSDKPAATYRAIAQVRMKLARQNFADATQRGLPASVALDEASAALALSNGTVVDAAQPTAFDRAHDEIVALVRDYAQGIVQPPTSHVTDNNGAVTAAADSSLLTNGDAGAPPAVTGDASPPSELTPTVGVQPHAAGDANGVADPIGTQWREEELGWSGVWTRRGKSYIFDAVWTRDGLNVRAVLTLSGAGNTASLHRVDTSDQINCDYTGTVNIAETVSGTYHCTNGGGGHWRATILGGR